VADITHAVLTSGKNLDQQAVVRFIPRNGDLWELLVYAPDYEGLFYHVASALQHSGYDVLQARVSSTSDGHALDFFLCQPTRQAIPAEKVQQRVETALQDRRAPAARATAYTPRRLRHFHITPQVHLKPYENDPSDSAVFRDSRQKTDSRFTGQLLRQGAGPIQAPG